MEIMVAVVTLVIIALVLAFYFGKESGENSTKVDIQEEILSNVKKAKSVDNNITTDAKRDWLRKRSSK